MKGELSADDVAPQRWRKKPVVIEAMQMRSEDYDGMCAILGWINDSGGVAGPVDQDGFVGYIATLEGEMLIAPGDWVIRGVQGEFYPCKPDIFDATYERHSDGEDGRGD